MSRRRRVLMVLSALSLATLVAVMAAVVSRDGVSDDREAIADESSLFDDSTAIIVNQDERSVTRQDANGVYQATVSAVPERVEVAGQWVPISTELTQSQDGGFKAEAHPFFPEFAAQASESGLLTVVNNGFDLQMGLVGAAEVSAELTGADAALGTESGVRYSDILGDADLIVGLDGASVRQAVVIDSAPSQDLTVTWRVEARGLEPNVNEFGDLDFVDDSGAVGFTVARASLWDSSGSFGDYDGRAINVDYGIEELGDGVYTLSVTPPLEWLQDPDLVYPVYVDPTIYGSDIHAYKGDGYANTGVAQVGNSKQTSTCCDWRTVLKYELSPYAGVRVTSAYVYGYRRSGSSGNNNYQPGNTFQASSFSFGGVGSFLAALPIAYDGRTTDSYMGQWVSGLINSRSWGAYMMLTGQEANTVYSYKAINTYMVIEYVSLPVVNTVTVNGVAPGTFAEVNADDVVVAATGTNYYSGTSQLFQYVFTSSNGGGAYTSPWMSGASFRLPDTALTPGKNYTMKVNTTDNGVVAPVVPWGSSWSFRVQAAPTVVAGSVTVGGTALNDSSQPVTLAAPRPELSATVTDADGGTVWAVFTVLRNGVVVLDSVPGGSVTLAAGASGTSSVTLPFEIHPGDGYTLEVQAYDGHQASVPVRPKQVFKVGSGVTWVEIPGASDASVAP